MNVHFEIGLVGQHACLPILLEVLGCNHADGLDLHGFETQGDDVVHSFDNGTAFA